MSRRGDGTVLTNRKARHDYTILDAWECGIVLEGAEVKSLREHHANLQEAFARVNDGEVWLNGMHILPYPSVAGTSIPSAVASCCSTLAKIDEITRKTQEKGLTLIPLKVYFKDGRAKLELGLAKGKKNYDKRRSLASATPSARGARPAPGRGD